MSGAELFIQDLEINRHYLLVGQQTQALLQFLGAIDLQGRKLYVFQSPSTRQSIRLAARPDGSGTIEDARGVKVAIRAAP